MKPAFADAETLSNANLPHVLAMNGNAPHSKAAQASEIRTRLLNMILKNEQQRRSDSVPRQSPLK